MNGVLGLGGERCEAVLQGRVGAARRLDLGLDLVEQRVDAIALVGVGQGLDPSVEQASAARSSPSCS